MMWTPVGHDDISSVQSWGEGAELDQSLQQAIETDSETSDPWESYIQKTLLHMADVTISSSQDSIYAAQAQLDAEIEAMKRAIRIFSARRNAMVSCLSRIPEDVLLQIFLFLVDDDPPKMVHHMYERRRSLGWIRVTHVCRSWREIALSNSCLWTHIEPDITTDWLSETLSRSDPRPLKADLSLGSTDANVTVDVLGNHSRRLSQLDIRIDRLIDFDDWADFVAHPSPLLESLSLRFSEGSDDLDVDPDYILTTVSHPRLRRLTMHVNFQPPCDAQVLHNLVYLELVGASDCDRRPFVDSLIPILEDTPQL
ncbi:hypothetical protein DENSPDRAFT_228392 [Dentipellis sp. KUC8613]|nr:hypothetical protein DENSPDRAFT_228392 [Dentipellis sp. KUC8613]